MLSLLAYPSVPGSPHSTFLAECWSESLCLYAKLPIFTVKLGYEFQVCQITQICGYIPKIALALISLAQQITLRKPQQVRKSLPSSPSTAFSTLEHMKIH